MTKKNLCHVQNVRIVFDLFNWFYSFFLNRLSLICNWKKKKRLVWKIQVNLTWPTTQLTHLKMTYFYLQPNWPNPSVLPRLISAHHQSLIVPCFNSELYNANSKALSISHKHIGNIYSSITQITCHYKYFHKKKQQLTV